MTPSDAYRERLRRIESEADAALLTRGLIGIEKESLRTDAHGVLSKLPHPAALGSALTNDYITTDFSEALLEFVTPAYPQFWQTLQFLCDLHQFTYRSIGDELLWVTSMPCRVGPDETIPLARYGSSNIGTMKTVYRRGLGYRYGRLMQTIAGIHFNYSVAPELWPALNRVWGHDADDGAFRSAAYLGLIRNFRRLGWLVLYLYGASPAMCKSFVDDPYSTLPELDPETLFEPYATSLRMSDLGYSNRSQSRLTISLNDLDEYIGDLCRAITTPEPAYRKIGVKVDGRYRQLNSNILQIENEYYSAIRPKQVALSGERPTMALRRGGIQYVELRSLDLNVYDPVGLNSRQARFLEMFLLHCMLQPSPPMDAREFAATSENHSLTARLGRDPGLRLGRGDRDILLADWAGEILDDIGPLAELMDAGDGGDRVDILAEARRLVDDADLTPSARIVAELMDSGRSFFEFGLDSARSHRDYFMSLEPVNEARMQAFADEAARSIEAQREVEAGDRVGFDEFLDEYFAAPGC